MFSLFNYQYKTHCYSEYDLLKEVILCKPEHMKIRAIINDTQKKFKDEGIHIKLAMEQHDQFVHTLKDLGVHVTLLPTYEKFPEQVFTRDIGFTLGQTIFVAEMAEEVRNGEELILKKWLEDEKISYYNLIGDKIEGGDVLIDGNSIYVGISNRTNEKAIEHLQSLLKEYEVHAVPFTEKYLHLDCVFNILSPNEALFYPNAFDKNEKDFLASRYDLLEVTKEEQFTLGTNVLSIGNKIVISLPVNEGVNSQLRDRGFEVIEVDITEIIKSGGSFRCCTLPVVRDGKQKG